MLRTGVDPVFSQPTPAVPLATFEFTDLIMLGVFVEVLLILSLESVEIVLEPL